jgi:hypothetical protein
MTTQITRQNVADKLSSYLQGRTSLETLVNWAEEAILDGDIDPQDSLVLSEIIGQLGLADVRAFGLTWEDCQEMLHRLGFQAHIYVEPVG